MSATPVSASPLYSPSDLRDVELWVQAFRAAALRDRRAALVALGERLQAAHTAPDLWERVARTLLADKDFKGAEALLRRGLHVYPQRHALGVLLGNTLRLVHRYAESEQTLRAILDTAPRNALAARSLAYLLREQGRTHAAAAVLLAHPPDDSAGAEVARERATLLSRCGQVQAALTLCDTTLARHPDAKLFGLSGVLAATLGQFERAAVDLRRAVGMDPELATAWLWLALTHRFETRDDPDLLAMNAAAGRVSDDSHTGICLGFARGKAYDDLGDIPAAVQALRAANAAAAARTPWQAADWGAKVARSLAARISGSVAPPAFTPVFIVGLPRTGTTLAATLLSKHPQVRSRGELGWLGELAAQGGTHGYSRAFLDRAAAVYSAQLRRDDEPARFYIDKNPINFLHLDLAAALFPNARVIHCRRGLRDTALSIWRQHLSGADALFTHRFADIAQVAADEDRLMRHWHERSSLPIYELEYEILVRRPEETRVDILRSIGADDPGATIGSDSPDADLIGTASLWQVRQPVSARSIGRWKAYAPHLPELLQIPERRAGMLRTD